MRGSSRPTLAALARILLVTWITMQAVNARSQPIVSDSGNLCRDAVRTCQAGDTARAETLLVAQLAMRPDDPCALTNLGNLALLRGDAVHAKVLYRMALRADTVDAGILMNYAAVLHALGDAAADSVYRRALRQSRTSAELLNKLGVRRGPGVDSLKAADLSSLISAGSGSAGDVSGRRRLPDNHFAVLLEKTYAEERGSGRATAERTQSTRRRSEHEQANRVILASLPLYWKQ